MSDANSKRVEKVKEVYADLGLGNLHQLVDIYASDVVFVDPVNRIEGRDHLISHFEQSYQEVVSCRFDFDDTQQIIASDNVLLTWQMHLVHRKLAGGKPVSVSGSSLLRFSPQGIQFHRDWFDLGEMVYENVPLLGTLVRLLKSRLAVH